MPKKDCILMLGLSIASGLAGGALAVRLLASPPVFAASSRGRAIEAQDFRLLDNNGAVVGRFHVDKDGGPALLLFDSSGVVRANLGLLPNGSPHLALSDKDGAVRAAVALWSDQRSGIFLTDAKAVERASLSALPSGNPTLAISDDAGTTRTVVGGAPAGIAAKFPGHPESLLALLDGSGKILWAEPAGSAPAAPAGLPQRIPTRGSGALPW